MNQIQVAAPALNHILAILPSAERERLQPLLSRVTLVSGQVLYERGSLVEEVYFIESGMISLVSGTNRDDFGVEVGTVGCEGLVGCASMFDADTTAFSRTLAQIAGVAWRISAERLRDNVAELPGLRRLGFRYLQALQAQAAQSVACNALHPLKQRAARWLLVSQDRAGSGEMRLTQEFLSNMLGVRRPGVTLVAVALQDKGLIKYSRGWVKILNRRGLEQAACGCYRIVADEYARLLTCT